MKNSISAFIVGLSIILTAVVLSNGIQNRNAHEDTIVVTGLGSEDFISDLIVWRGTFKRTSLQLQDAYQQLNADRVRMKAFLIEQGIQESEQVFDAVDMMENYDYVYDANGRSSRVFAGYTLTQSVRIESQRVDEVEEFSRTVTNLIEKGMELRSDRPEYFYTGLAALKHEMIARATEDATTRAQQIAENSGAALGPLRNARMGVFQITGQNSSEDFSWGGTYNTRDKKKTANITMRLEFGIE
jgi:hypothetical protein